VLMKLYQNAGAPGGVPDAPTSEPHIEEVD
jgi:hypothetical protein